MENLKEMQWISVSERLPEDDEDCLVTIYEKWSGRDESWYTDKACFSTSPDRIYLWCKDMEGICGFGCFWDDWNEGQEIYVTHWMPLPGPAKS